MAAMNSGNKEGEPRPWEDRDHIYRAWGLLLFGVIGVTATTVAVSQLRRTGDWFYSQFKKTESSTSWRNTANSSNRGGYSDESWKRYNQRMHEESEEERARVERIRRMQRIFNRERYKFKRSYEHWRDKDHGAYHHIPQDDWYYRTNTYYQEQRTNYDFSPRHGGNYSMSHHYKVLGLDWSRPVPFSDAEIKSAFRAKALECHPDQNQDNKEAAEAKFKEIMASYEAIKERKI
ncbi:uncharacterized protein LOC141827495 [Curcuma longa]|uniref:uncharacterized protein LOC141827495 n=1 Tax=Curcuma longa TaxID=136217 RepID=UPI003D9F9EB6